MTLYKSKIITITLVLISLGVLLYLIISKNTFTPFISTKDSISNITEEIDPDVIETLEKVKNAIAVSDKSDNAKDIRNVDFEKYLEMIDTVILVEELRILFDPDNFRCDFNRRLSNKIKNKKEWLPPSIKFDNKDFVKMNKKVLKFNESSPAYIFNLLDFTYKVKRQDGQKKDTTIRVAPEGSLLFKKDKALQFVNKERSSFIVNIDCDGYYKATVIAGLGGGRKSLKANAQRSQGKKVSSFVGLGYIYSPFQFIMEPASTPINGNIHYYERLSHLTSILALARIIGIKEFTVSPSQQLKMIWASNSGSNTLNNRASLSASGSLGIVSGNVDGSISVNKGVKYRNFNSYLIGKVNSQVGAYSKQQISKSMAKIFSSIEMHRHPKWDNKDLVFSFRLNEQYCNKKLGKWKIQDSGFSLDSMTPNDGDDDICTCKVSGDINTNNKSISLKGVIEGQEVDRILELPVLD